MTSLEDSILKKNIPGKYTTWKEDQNDTLTESEGQKLGPLTCIKGGDGEESGGGNSNDSGNDGNLLDDDDDDDEFMEKYRQQRMQEIQEEHAMKQRQKFQGRRQNPQDQGQEQLDYDHSSLSVGPGGKGPVHIIVDAVPEIDGVEYVNMVNEQQQQQQQDNSLIVLLYHDINDSITSKLLSLLAEICIRNHATWTKKQKMLSLSSSLSSSASFPMICSRLNSNNTSINIDPIVLPAILIHQNGGILTHNLTPVIGHLVPPERSSGSATIASFTISDVYELLESCAIPLFYNLHDDDDDDDDNIEDD